MIAGYPTLPIAGAGALYSGEQMPKLVAIKTKLFRRHGKRSGTFCLVRHQLGSRKLCVSQVTSSDFNRTFAFRKDASDENFLTNVEDTDEAFDELFNKYGKVVFRRNDQKPLAAEVDDDAESLSFAVELAKVASDVKAGDIKVLFVKPLVYWTRFFIIATAFSRPQIDAIGSRIRDLAEEKYGRVPSGDTKPNSWTLLDFGDVVVHIFLPPERDFYNLEEFYGNAAQVKLPFDSQPSQFHN